MKILYLSFFVIVYGFVSGQERMTISELAEKASVMHGIAMSYGNIGADTVSVLVPLNSEQQFFQMLGSIEGYELIVVDDKEILLRKEEIPNIIELQCWIRSKDTDEPLELAMIGFPESGRAVFTDRKGKGTLYFEESNIDKPVEISMVGFQKYRTTIAGLRENPTVQLGLLSMDVEEVIIEDKVPILKSGENNEMVLSTETKTLEASQIAGRDVLRSLQLYAGVSAFQDNTSAISIRGSNYDQTMIAIDEVPVYGKGHYFGMFSAINPLYTNTISLYKNNLPVKYGGRNGGLVDIESISNQNVTKVIGEAEISLLSSSGVIQIPVLKKLFLNVGGRTSFGNVNNKGFLGLFDDQVDVEGNIDNFTDLSRNAILSNVPDFSFFDVNGNLSYKGGLYGVSLDYYKSGDNLSQEISSSFTERRVGRTIQSKETYQNDENWSSEFISISGEYWVNDNLRLLSKLYTSSFAQNSLTINQLSRISRFNERDFEQEFSYDNGISEKGLSTLLVYDINQSSKVQAGVDAIRYETSINSSDRIAQRVRFGGDINVFSIFGEYNADYNDGWLLDAGARYSYHDVQNKNFFSPRFSLGKMINDNLVMKSAIGRQYQFTRILNFESLSRRAIEIWSLGGNNNVPVGRVDQVMLGFQYKKNRFLFDVESYRKWTDGLLNIALENPFISGDQITAEIRNEGYRFFLGDGDIYGIDVTTTYSGKKYSAILAYTLSKSTESYVRIANGSPIPASLDRRHQFSLAHSYDFGKWSISSDIIWVSGRPYLDLEKLETDIDRNDQTFATSFSRLPSYIRFDIGVGYEFSIGEKDISLKASLVNAFDRDNVNYIQYTFALPEGVGSLRNRGAILGNTSNLLDRTLNLSASVKF